MKALYFISKAGCLLVCIFFTLYTTAQSPGGVSAGAARAWKIEHFEGSFASVSAFGAGSSNTIPDLWGYTGYITGYEFIGYDADYFGLQYSGTLEVPQTGSYSFNIYNIDDVATLFIDGTQIATATYSGALASATATISLGAGDHSIVLKFIETYGGQSVNISWSGPGLTTSPDIDGRFVRSDNAQLAAWYKASDLTITPNYSAGISKVNTYKNTAPGFTGNGDLIYGGSGWSSVDTTPVNFNSAVFFDGDDWFRSTATQNGLVFRTAPRTLFLVNDYTANLAGSHWLMGQAGGDGNTTNAAGFWKASATQTGMARSGDGAPYAVSAYTTTEPKLLTGDITLGTGNTASANNNRSSSANGGTAVVRGFTEKISNYNNNCCALELGALNGSYFSTGYLPELIYYPFELSTAQRQRVNTYLGIKYGITLQHNYVNTSGTTLWDLTGNTPYNNRIFGIGRELAAEGLNQKQSVSQMASQAGYNFLVLSTGTIAVTNAGNTSVLADGDYMLLGDDNGPMASQATEIPASFIASSGGCSTARLGREWKARVTGNPGPVTLRAGSSTSGSFLFPGMSLATVAMVDADGDGDFTTGTVSTYPSSSSSAGVVTFPNVTIPNGAVISFAWVVAAPGGVSNGLALWLQAGAGSSSNSNAAAVSSWTEQAASATGTGTATYYNDGANNFNPYIRFNGSSNYFQMPAGYANFTDGASNFFVTKFANLTQNFSRFYDFANGAPNNNIIFGKNATTAGLFVAGSNTTTNSYTFTAGGISTASYQIYNSNIPGGVAGTAVLGGFSVNGLSIAGTTNTNVPGNTVRNTCYIGRSLWAADSYLAADVPEGIIYNTTLTATQQKQVNSYLAIKYGLTLDASAASYLASDGVTSVYNYSTHWNNILGIGRDDCSGLVQKQSASAIAGDNITVGLGTIATTNIANTGSFSANKMFLMLGNDGGALAKTTIDIPAAYSAGSCNPVRYVREWKVKNTGGVGAVQVNVGNSNYPVGKAMARPALAIDQDGDGNFATGTIVIVNAGSTRNGLATFNNVSLTDGSVFTLCWTQAAPGGVTSNLALWLAADGGADAVADNTAVGTWADLSVNAMNGTAVGSPVFRSGASLAAANFNPVVSFNGTSQYFNLPTGFTDFTAGTAAFAVLNTNFGSSGSNTYGRCFHFSTGANVNAITFHRNNLTSNMGMETFNASGTSQGYLYTSSLPMLPANGTMIYGWTIGAGTSGQSGRSGTVLVNAGIAASSSSMGTPLSVSRTLNRVGYGNGNEYINGYMPELVLYNRDLTSTERQKINSYLAVKYGKTLAAAAGAYLNSAGDTLYNYTSFFNRITGIGRDDCSGQDQRQSKSAETGALVTLSNGNSLAASNDANASTFAANQSFELFGDNGKAVTWTGVDNIAGSLVRLNRVWHIKETGTVQTVYLEMPGNSSAATVKLPASNSPTDPVYLLVTSNTANANFKGAVSLVEMIPDVPGAATKWSTSYNFSDGDYFTFATKKLCLGPAGNTDGLTSWYRADNKTTGPIAATSGTMADESGANQLLTRNGSGVATVIAGSATSFNYNRAIALTGNAVFTRTALSESSLISVSEGAMYAAGTIAANLFMFNNSTVNKTGINAAPVFMAGTAGAFTNSTPASVYSMNISAGMLGGSQNGTVVASAAVGTSLPAAATYTAGIGTYAAGASFNNGLFAEAFSYNRGLTLPEQQVLNSYLAIKNGQMLSHNYYTPDYDGTNAATSTIYDISTYNNRVFGIGVDTTGCFYQRQSTSQLTGSMLKMSLGTALAPENASNLAGVTTDRTYVAGGDDNGAVSWSVTGIVPAIYNPGNCVTPWRIARQWKCKAINSGQSVLIAVPDNISSAAAKLPGIPAGSTQVFMLVNENTDFSINANEEEIAMTLNPVSKEWETSYTFPDGVYKYITFVAKQDVTGLQPVVIVAGAQDAHNAICNSTPYIYYKGTLNSSNAIMAVNPNGNSWSPASTKVDNQGTLTGGTGGGTFSNTGNGYYQTTDGFKTIRISKRLHTIVAPGSYTINNGIIVRLYYANADTMSMVSDAMPGVGAMQAKGWFKYPASSAASTLAAMVPGDLPGGIQINPVAWGTEQGVKYVEFLVNSFSTFGYYTKTTLFLLPVELAYFKGDVINCENRLSWQSQVEQGLALYEVQYSSDGLHFETAGPVLPKGSGSVYSFKQLAAGTSTFYRLKTTDKDGKTGFSQMITLDNHCGQSLISIYPNPVNDYVLIKGLKPAVSVVHIQDAHGRMVINQKADQPQQKFNTTQLAQGIYFVEITNGQEGDKTVFKIIKN